MEFKIMENELVIRLANVDDINTIGFLAQQTWPTAYGSILAAEQITYMLNLFYAPSALNEQMIHLNHQFVVAELNDEPTGFASYSPIADEVYKLHKLYVLPGTQGKGIGKALLDFVSNEIKLAGASALQLGVNRFNPALKFYEKIGFTKLREEKTSIGNGFVMDDYIMELILD
jgi:diamine N-acetyltransferase